MLFFGYFFHPVHGLAIELFLNGDMAQGGGRSGTVPVLFARREPDYVARPYFFYWSTPALDPSATGCDDERLAEGVGMPGGASAGFERYDGAGNTSGVGSIKG